ncbi:phage holin family protein [Dyella sp.]|uniref:phage holin family protein n=1 Tax=Dyella sp. TaxID=1869338 RepID=UPI002B4A8DAC|nr:phage holin family protein [Dyella sp.]HKT28795.1 phage holin family protein [Dyella sp.]
MPLPFALIGVWSLLQLMACLVIVLRLLTFRRGHSRHRHAIAWASWLLVVACTTTAVKLLCGIRPPPGPLEALLTVALAILLVIHRGNLAHVLRAPRAWLAWIWRRDTW